MLFQRILHCPHGGVFRHLNQYQEHGWQALARLQEEKLFREFDL